MEEGKLVEAEMILNGEYEQEHKEGSPMNNDPRLFDLADGC